MSSSAVGKLTDPFQPIAKATGLDKVPRKLIGEPIKEAKNDLLGTGDVKYPTIKPRGTYKGLAIGTQTGGTRKPLGSTSGLNT